MPDSTRPRYVNPPPVYDGGGNNDINQLLQAIQQMYNQPQQPMYAQPQHGFLGSLFQALPQAIAVGASKDPGAALMAQINQQRAIQFQKETEEAQRRVKMEGEKRQLTLRALELAETNKKEEREFNNKIKLFDYERGAKKIDKLDEREMDEVYAERERKNTLDFKKNHATEIAALAQNEAHFKALPQLMQMSVEAQAKYRTLDPTLDPYTIRRLADWESGVDQATPLSVEDKKLLNSLAQKFHDIESNTRRIKNENTEAETAYIKAGKPGSYNNPVNSAAKVAEAYAKNVDDAIVQRSFQGIPQNPVLMPDGTIIDRTQVKGVDQLNLGRPGGPRILTAQEADAYKLDALKRAQAISDEMKKKNAPPPSPTDTSGTLDTAGDTIKERISVAIANLDKIPGATKQDKINKIAKDVASQTTGMSAAQRKDYNNFLTQLAGMEPKTGVNPTGAEVFDATSPSPTPNRTKVSAEASSTIAYIRNEIKTLENALRQRLAPAEKMQYEQKLAKAKEHLAYALSQHPEIK